MMEEHCDWKGKCKRKAYRDIYPIECSKDGSWGWFYLCFWHFQIARIYAILGFRRKFGWGELEE